MVAGPGARVRRMLPSLALLAGLLIAAAIWIAGSSWMAGTPAIVGSLPGPGTPPIAGSLPIENAHETYFALLHLLGVPAFRFPFLDTHGELAIIECHRRGLDVYLTNPCDALGRVHVYTPLWFRLAFLPIDTSWTPLLGSALALAFAASLVLLPPGRDARATGMICAGAVSPAVGFAIERGNVDLLMFVLAALAGALMLRRLPTRLLAFPVVLLAAGLKVYPATLLILALRERLALCLAIAAASLAALLVYAAIDAAGLREMLAVVPAGTSFIYSFGAKNLPAGLGVVFGWSPAVLTIVQSALLFVTVVFAASRLEVLRPAMGTLTAAEATSLLIGAVLILGCFVIGQSGEYRAVFLLFVLPAVTALARAPGPGLARAPGLGLARAPGLGAHELAGTRGPARRLAACTTWVILLQLWGDVASAPLDRLGGIAADNAAVSSAALLLWLARELAWWWTIAMLLALLLAVLRDLPIAAALLGRRAGR